MRRMRRLGTVPVFGVLAVAAFAAHAQQPPPERPLTIYPPSGLPVIPVMEGWYDNDDGSVTISFGYHNKNDTGVILAPFGETNRIEPAEFDGVQPTFFDRGRHTGVFTIRLPAERRNETVWWHIQTGDNPPYKVPGRAISEAYQLDRRPRPQGSLSPVAWFEDGGERSYGPEGIVAVLDDRIRANTPVTLAVHAMDPSERDPDDPRFQEPVALRAVWEVHQGPAAVEFRRQETAAPEEPAAGQRRTTRLARNTASLPRGSGTANMIATFREPGEYLLRIQVNNWAAPDSSEADQCCWTNIYQRINVLP
jgi:hypothetical protein